MGIIQLYILYTRFDNFEGLNKKFLEKHLENDKIDNIESHS